MSRDAQFEIVSSNNEVLHIKDVGDHSKVLTVTNDAESVVGRLHRSGDLGARKLLYTDSDGAVDELKHDGAGRFTGYAPGPDRA